MNFEKIKKLKKIKTNKSVDNTAALIYNGVKVREGNK
mgnify:CR=1 FL=1